MSLGGLKTRLLAGAALAIAAAPAYADGGMKDTADANWWDAVKFSGHIEAGIMGNPDGPANGVNFGRLFDDRANEPVLNQFLLTAERPLDTKLADQYQLGFKFQGMYGTDARYTHFLGELDEAITRDRNQLDVVEAYLNFHAPILTKGGVDIKAGQFVTLEGAEVIDAAGNFFYSHSYIFNFGIPFKHTGVLTTTHVNDTLDIYAGIDSGVNTSLGCATTRSLGNGDNNCAGAFHGGIGLNFLGGDLTVLATTHIGPELPQDNHDFRYLNDITTVWKVNKKLTLTNDLNYIADELGFGKGATGWGIAQYATYAIDDNWSVGVRGEIFRDENGFFVGAFPNSLDFVKAEEGLPNTSYLNAGPVGKPTTYYELTFGANYKPTISDKHFEGLVIRPEVRFDWASGSTPFDNLTSDRQVTASIDFIIPFSAPASEVLK